MKLISTPGNRVQTSWAEVILGEAGVYETADANRIAELLALGFNEEDTNPDDGADTTQDGSSDTEPVEEGGEGEAVNTDDVVSIAEQMLDDVSAVLPTDPPEVALADDAPATEPDAAVDSPTAPTKPKRPAARK